jgi:hypothetical protein
MDVRDLKEFLQGVPDGYEVRIKDINFGGGTLDSVEISDFQVLPKKQQLLLPAVGQEFID